MHIKPKDPRQFATPAPGAYNPEAAEKDVKKTAPRCGFIDRSLERQSCLLKSSFIYDTYVT